MLNSLLTTTLILAIFEDFRMHSESPIDQYESVGKPLLKSKIQDFVENNIPVSFVMLGFPFKSMNYRDKVLGKLPDEGEMASMLHFKTFLDNIKAIYPPGATITIVQDGYVFNDLMEVSDGTVEAYKEMIRSMGSITSTHWYSLEDFYSKKTTLSSSRSKLMSHFGIDNVELERRILMDPDVNFLYRGMIRFMTGDLAIKDFVSNAQLHKTAKALARQMMLRNEAFSALTRAEFSSDIRLSMHHSINNGNKYSVNLIKGGSHSPWHSTLVKRKDGTVTTMHRKDASELGHELVYKDGRPFYFQELELV